MPDKNTKKDSGMKMMVDKDHLDALIDGCTNHRTEEDEDCGSCDFDSQCDELMSKMQLFNKAEKFELERE